MPIALSPASTTIDSGAHVDFTARVTGGKKNTRMTLQVTGDVGVPLPQQQTFVLDGAGAGETRFAVTFRVGSDTTTGLVCRADDDSMPPAVSTVTIIAPVRRMRAMRRVDLTAVVQAPIADVALVLKPKPTPKPKRKAPKQKPAKKKTHKQKLKATAPKKRKSKGAGR